MLLMPCIAIIAPVTGCLRSYSHGVQVSASFLMLYAFTSCILPYISAPFLSADRLVILEDVASV